MKKNGKAALGFFRKEDKLMINDKDICAGSVFEGLINGKKVFIENVIESKDGFKYILFRDEKGNKHQISYEMFKRCNLKKVVEECGS